MEGDEEVQVKHLREKGEEERRRVTHTPTGRKTRSHESPSGVDALLSHILLSGLVLSGCPHHSSCTSRAERTSSASVFGSFFFNSREKVKSFLTKWQCEDKTCPNKTWKKSADSIWWLSPPSLSDNIRKRTCCHRRRLPRRLDWDDFFLRLQSGVSSTDGKTIYSNTFAAAPAFLISSCCCVVTVPWVIRRQSRLVSPKRESMPTQFLLLIFYYIFFLGRVDICNGSQPSS